MNTQQGAHNMKIKTTLLAAIIMAAVGVTGTAVAAPNPFDNAIKMNEQIKQEKTDRLAREEAQRQKELAAQRAHEQKLAQIAAQQKAKAAAAAAKVRQAKENERLADKARDQGYEDELRALAIEEKRMELAHKKAMLEAQSKAADKYVEQDLNVRKAATDVIQSQADANRNITKGIQNNLESQGKAEEKRAGNWFNR